MGDPEGAPPLRTFADSELPHGECSHPGENDPLVVEVDHRVDGGWLLTEDTAHHDIDICERIDA
jgi:predicted ATPase